MTAVHVTTAEGREQNRNSRFLSEWYQHADYYDSRDAKLGRLKITPEAELELGRNAKISLPPSTDAEAQAFVQQLLMRLSATGPALAYPIDAVVYEAPDVNALTVPGKMFVSTGLLRFVESEGELAAVVAHELSHIYAHHASRRVVRQARGHALMNFIGGALGPGGVNSDPSVFALASLGAQTTIELFLKAFNRGEESEADRYAMHVLYNAGVPPRTLVTVLERMYRANASRPLKLLATHPPLDDRVADLEKYGRGFPDLNAPADSAAFLRAIKKVAPPAVAAPAPATPATADPPATSPPASSLPPVVAPPASSLPPVVVPPASSLPPVKKPGGRS